MQKKTISFRKLPIYNKKPMSLRKGIGFCQQSEMRNSHLFYLHKKRKANLIAFLYGISLFR